MVTIDQIPVGMESRVLGHPQSCGLGYAEEWPQCDVTADYDYWSMPKSYSNEEGCLLGVKYGFHRRKETSCCQNTFDFRTEHRIGDKCRCSQLDLSCDFTASTMQYNSTVGWPQGMFCVQDEEVGYPSLLSLVLIS